MYYVATLDPHDDDGSSRYNVTFPSLPGCVTQGTDLKTPCVWHRRLPPCMWPRNDCRWREAPQTSHLVRLQDA